MYYPKFLFSRRPKARKGSGEKYAVDWKMVGFQLATNIRELKDKCKYTPASISIYIRRIHRSGND